MPEPFYESGKTLSYNHEILHLENCTLEKERLSSFKLHITYICKSLKK
jgi:hypothetical protein